MSLLFDSIRGQVADLTAKFRKAASDGLTIRESVALVVRFAAAAHHVVHSVPGTTADERKTAVLEAVDVFYAKVIAPLDLPGVPNVVEGAFVDPSIGSIIHFAAAGVLDVIAEVQRDAGILPPVVAEDAGS